MSLYLKAAGAVVAVLLGVAIVFSFERPPVDTIQRGFRGVAMGLVANPRRVAEQIPQNQVPEPQGATEKAGTPSSQAYENVQVLGDVDANEFIRLMSAITEWVSPEGGCNYCHAEGQPLSADTLYTKVVARRMIQMTRTINANWKNHVAETGVTCYSCHRGQPVPSNIWFEQATPAHFQGLVEGGGRPGQNAPSGAVAFASLPNDVYRPFLEYAQEIRVAGNDPLPTGNRSSVKGTEATYGLMMHFSQSLGVNCTFCHNSRAFFDWNESTPQRVSAWHGIRMVRDINTTFMNSLKDVFPQVRLGELGDVAKVNCLTCHQGAYKPLYGVSMLKDYPELGGPAAQAANTTPMPTTAAAAAAPAEQTTR